MKILITGGTGFIGSALCQYFIRKQYKIYVLTRKQIKHEQINFIQDLYNYDLNFDVIINLAGEPLNGQRWSEEVKKNIIASRVKVTKQIIDYIKETLVKPKVLISGSAIGFYGTNENKVFKEDSCFVSGYTHDLCKIWEDHALYAENYGVRVCLIRTGIVIGNNGGILKSMLKPFKYGVGMQFGDGKQWMSWIHLKDVIKIIDFLVQHEELSGPFNLTAPNPVNNKIFTDTLAEILNRPRFVTLPRVATKLIFGEMGERLILQGQNVIPSKLIKAGYKFEFTSLKPALLNILN